MTIFYTLWCLCVVTQSILKFTDAITKRNRQELYKMLNFSAKTTHLRFCEK